MEIVDVEEKLNADLLNHFKGEKDGYVQVGERKWCLPVRYRKVAEQYKNFEVRYSDVWIMGYPRSGSTLTEEIVWLLTHGLDFEGNKKNRVRLLETDMIWNEKTEKEVLEKFPEEAENLRSKRETLKTLKEDKTRRVIKTHLPFELLNDDIRKKACKVIYICRYPKDVSVSYYHLQSALRQIKYCGDFETYLRYFRNGHCMFGPYFEHIRQGWQRIGSQNFMIVFFEEFKKDVAVYIRKLARFLDIPITDDDVKKLQEHLSLNNFRKTMNKNLKGENNEPVDFVRKGKVGGWRDFFNDEMNKEIDEWIEENCDDIGIIFPEQVQ